MTILNKRWSFSTKVSFWVVLMAVPVFIVSVGLHFRQAHEMILTESVERANGVLNTSMHRIRRYLVTAETATQVHSWMIEKSMQPDSLKAFSHKIARLNPYIDGCAIGTNQGVLAQYPQRFLSYSIRKGDTIVSVCDTVYNYFSAEWYKRPYESGKPEWVVYYDETNQLALDNHGMLATYTMPLFDRNHRFIGVISSGLSLLHISQILAEEKPYPHSYFMLVDKDGRFVGHPDSTRLFSKKIFNVADPQKEADLIALGYEMTRGRQGHMSVMIDGSPSLVCFKPVPNTPWSLAIVCPDSDIMKDYNRFTDVVIALIVVGMIVIVLYCHRMVTRALRPLRELRNKTQEIANGNMDVSIERSHRIDNIGSLQNSFAVMLESLRHYMDSVRTASEEAKHYNDELERATQLVVEADKQKTAFVQNMTHQVRTPLNIIMGYAQILNIPTTGLASDAGMLEEEVKSLAGTMYHNSKLLNRMVLMLFDSSDLGITESERCKEHEPVQVNMAMQETVDYVMRLNPGNTIHFETDVDDEVTISTNKKYLQNSLGEVMLNAIKYSDREHIVARVARADQTIRFIIEDTGKGIPEADCEHIFEFFTKIDDFSEGLGLGLPLTKRHAQKLGGDFYMDTDYTKGCRFIFELPIDA